MYKSRFKQVDVFTDEAFKGNPVAVVLDGDQLGDEDMAAFARWTNLAETTFVTAPEDPRADYKVRIFSSLGELPFAGHPTLGTCHAWLESGGNPHREEVVQECGVGLVRIRRQVGRLAFLAPPLIRSGPVDAEKVESMRMALGLQRDEILDARWVDNGAGWLALRVANPRVVLRVNPNYSRLGTDPVGIFAQWQNGKSGEPTQFEVRAFIAGDAMPEDPVTGSLNAGIAQWLVQEKLAASTFVMCQGTALQRAGRVFVEQDGDDIWIGGSSLTLIDGLVNIPRISEDFNHSES